MRQNISKSGEGLKVQNPLFGDTGKVAIVQSPRLRKLKTTIDQEHTTFNPLFGKYDDLCNLHNMQKTTSESCHEKRRFDTSRICGI
jgi:hypothetical protein